MKSLLNPTTQQSGDQEVDPRPRFGIGHVSMAVSDVRDSLDFYEKAGMRKIADMGHAAILELRGGTHLIIHRGELAPRSSIIADDADETHRLLDALGAELARSSVFPRTWFVATDPDGNLLVVNSNTRWGSA